MFPIARCCCRLLYPYNDINVAISCCYMICIHCINGSTYRYLVKVLFNVITVCLCNLMAYTYTIIRHIVILHWHVDECSWIKIHVFLLERALIAASLTQFVIKRVTPVSTMSGIQKKCWFKSIHKLYSTWMDFFWHLNECTWK